MRIALAQVDSHLGDLDTNARRARDAVSEARAGGADLVVFPELQLSGYLGGIARETSCSPATAAARPPQAVSRRLRALRGRQLLDPGETMRVFDTALGRMAILICNDPWQPFLPSLAVHDGAHILLVPACSSTAVAEAEAYCRELTRFHARMLECFVVFVNRVGGAEAPRHEAALVFADVDPPRRASCR